MKKAAVAAVLLAGMALTVGVVGSSGSFEESVNADVRTDNETEEAAEEDSAAGIDTSIPVEPGSRIAVVSKCVAGEFWDMVHKGMSAAVKDINTAYGFKSDDQIKMTFEGPNDELNVEEQVNTLDAVIAENPAVLCLSASDMDSCQAQIETAMENDIPVIVFDSNVSDDQLVTAFCGTDNESVGQIAGEKMASALNQQGKLLIFSAQGKTESNQKRVSGFKSAIAEYADMEIGTEIYADQVEDMAAAMQEALTEHPDAAGVFCTNADMSDLYLSLDQGDAELPVMIGVDATTTQQEALKSGKEYGIVSQAPYDMGYQTILSAAQAANSATETLEEEILLEPAWIDSTNLEAPEYSNYIYK